MLKRSLLLFLALFILGCPSKKAVTIWEQVDSQEGGFSLSFPGKPTITQEPTDTPAGMIDSTIYLMEDPKTKTEYMITFAFYPADLTRIKYNVFDKLRKSMKGTLVEDDMNEYGEYYVQHFKETYSDGMIRIHKFYLVNDKFIYLAISGQEKDIDQNDVTKFFNSFKLTEG